MKMNPQDVYLKYTNAQTGAQVVSYHRTWDKQRLIKARNKAAQEHSNEDERGTVVEATEAEYKAAKK